MVKQRLVCLSLFVLCLLSACISPDLENSSIQKVVVYTDHVGNQDSLIYNHFYKNEKIKVYVRLYSSEEIIRIIQDEKYDSYADLIVLHGANQLANANKRKLFRPFSNENIKSRISNNYISTNKNWVALSKTPIVIAYDKRVLKADTLSNYSDLLFPNWKGKIALPNIQHTTLTSLESSLSQMEAKILHNFKSKLIEQSNLPKTGGDLAQIKRIQNNQAQLAIIELASMEKRKLEKDSLANQLKNQVGIIFPSQMKKGSLYNVTGAGIYRYARNPQNAQKLLEYLTSKGAQYFFASGRFEFPVNEAVKVDYRLEQYGKFRARFYAPKIH